LACDSAVTRVLVTRHPSGTDDPTLGGTEDLAARLQAALVLLPRALGGPPIMPLELGRSTRVISPAQRTALAVRDGGCGFPGCDRPLAWCEGHHLVPWWRAAPPTCPIWPCSVGPIIGPCMRAAGNSSACRMAASALPHPIDDPAAPPEPTDPGRGPDPDASATCGLTRRRRTPPPGPDASDLPPQRPRMGRRPRTTG
jgi:hypothetical protein